MSTDNALSQTATKDSGTSDRDVVRSGYDAIAQTYLEWAVRNGTEGQNSRVPQLDRLLAVLPNASAASVLELGCGAGVPGTQVLSKSVGRVIANDISEAQVSLAREHVSSQNVEFVAGDMTHLTYSPETFDAVVGFYSIIHLPREDQREMISRIAGWLKPNGFLLCNLGIHDNPGSTADWLGTAMYWSSFSPEGNKAMLRDAGFEFVYEEVHEEKEDGVVVPFQWILAKKAQKEAEKENMET